MIGKHDFDLAPLVVNFIVEDAKETNKRAAQVYIDMYRYLYIYIYTYIYIYVYPHTRYCL
jgi:hypothetical protein